MGDYTPKFGDRVRVVLEGNVSRVNGQHFDVGFSRINTQSAICVSVEKIEPPVEVFQPGDVVRDMFGIHYAVTQSGYVRLTDGQVYVNNEGHFTSERYDKVELG